MADLEMAALRRAKDALGSESALANVVGVKQPSVNYALNKAEKVPAEWCIKIHLATAALGKLVTCHELRPDLWPEDFQPEPAPEPEHSDSEAAA